MNDYRMAEERTIAVCEESHPPIHDVSLSSLMHASYEKAQAALIMAYRINCHLFGEGVAKNEDGTSPSCFMGELVMTDNTINSLCTELECIMKRLGV